MLRKKEVYTTITPIPGFIPRQLAIDILHSHSEVITLNPLVLEHKAIKAPRDAQSDEFYSTWYEITERIQYVPGMGRMGSGKINFNGCFHDMPWGLQTHIYAPMNIDLRNKYRIEGNQPGYEPPIQPEIGLAGLGAPADGLYLREDIEIKCNFTMISFVKAQLKTASKEMVSRIIKKAELLDAGVLQAMVEEGKLRTINPADRSHNQHGMSPGPGVAPSPATIYSQPGALGGGPPMSPQLPYHLPRPVSVQPGQYSLQARPSTAGSQTQKYGLGLGSGTPPPMELAAPHQQAIPQTSQAIVMELPGDFYHPQPSPQYRPQPSPAHSQHSDRDAQQQHLQQLQQQQAADPRRWSQQSASGNNPGAPQPSPGSRPTSIQSQGQQQQQYGGANNAGLASPPLDHKGFSNDLSTHSETQEEYRVEPLKPRTSSATWKLEPAPSALHGAQSQAQAPPQQPQGGYAYNPRDYANVRQ